MKAGVSQNMDLELEYYLGILNWNEKELLSDSKETDKIIFMCNKFIELMDYLKETYDKTFVKNALITMLALFTKKGCFFNQGRDIEDLSAQETAKIIKILNTELQ